MRDLNEIEDRAIGARKRTDRGQRGQGDERQQRRNATRQTGDSTPRIRRTWT
jgi:hypothetical protein